MTDKNYFFIDNENTKYREQGYTAKILEKTNDENTFYADVGVSLINPCKLMPGICYPHNAMQAIDLLKTVASIGRKSNEKQINEKFMHDYQIGMRILYDANIKGQTGYYTLSMPVMVEAEHLIELYPYQNPFDQNPMNVSVINCSYHDFEQSVFSDDVQNKDFRDLLECAEEMMINPKLVKRFSELVSPEERTLGSFIAYTMGSIARRQASSYAYGNKIPILISDHKSIYPYLCRMGFTSSIPITNSMRDPASFVNNWNLNPEGPTLTLNDMKTVSEFLNKVNFEGLTPAEIKRKRPLPSPRYLA